MNPRPPPPYHSASIQDVYVAGERCLLERAPENGGDCDKVIVYTLVVSPNKPIKLGMNLRLVPIILPPDFVSIRAKAAHNDPAHCITRDRLLPGHPFLPPGFVAKSPVVEGSVTAVLSIEKDYITLVVRNSMLTQSKVAFAHLSLPYIPGKTISPDVRTRLMRLIRGKHLPHTRCFSLMESCYVTEVKQTHAAACIGSAKYSERTAQTKSESTSGSTLVATPSEHHRSHQSSLLQDASRAAKTPTHVAHA